MVNISFGFLMRRIAWIIFNGAIQRNLFMNRKIAVSTFPEFIFALSAGWAHMIYIIVIPVQDRVIVSAVSG
jgi:hypothetical protein